MGRANKEDKVTRGLGVAASQRGVFRFSQSLLFLEKTGWPGSGQGSCRHAGIRAGGPLSGNVLLYSGMAVLALEPGRMSIEESDEVSFVSVGATTVLGSIGWGVGCICTRRVYVIREILS